jgi:hypothetical protein
MQRAGVWLKTIEYNKTPFIEKTKNIVFLGACIKYNVKLYGCVGIQAKR